MGPSPEAVVVGQKVAGVAANQEKWAKLNDKAKLAYLMDMQRTLGGMVEEWGQACISARGYKDAPEQHGGAFMLGPGMTGWALRQLIVVYKCLVDTGAPPRATKERIVNGQKVMTVHPLSMVDKMMFGFDVELWLEPGRAATQGECRRRTGVCAVLSAGNYEAPIDVFTKMFVESKVCVYARHENLAVSNRFVEPLFKALIRDGYFEVVQPGVPSANELVLHPKVDEVLMTGGAATYDRIVWGSAEAKAARTKRVCKPVEAELGAVSPYVLVPSDDWTDKDVTHHAGAVVGWKLLNSSAICASPQVMITSQYWPKRHAFISAVAAKLEAAPAIPVFYKGTKERADQARAAYKALEANGVTVMDVASAAERGDEFIKPVFIHGLTEKHLDSFSITNEAFAPVLIEISVDAKDPKTFLEKAKAAMNSSCFGSLSCTVMLPPQVEAALGGATVDAWLQELEWGTVGVNQWGGQGVPITTGVWGAFPKHVPEDIQSGIGILSNYLMFDHPQKQVLRGSFSDIAHPKGAADLSMSGMLKQFSHYTGTPSCWNFTKLLYAAVKAAL